MEAGMIRLNSDEIKRVPILTLAYVGDCVFDLYIRMIAAAREHKNAKDAHRFTVAYVNAISQARMADELLAKQLLTAEEAEIYRRGRNAKPHSTPKSAKLADYHKATGFEALLGYLYMTGQAERLETLCGAAYQAESEAGDIAGQ